LADFDCEGREDCRAEKIIYLVEGSWFVALFLSGHYLG